MERNTNIVNDDNRPKCGMLAKNQDLATVWLATGLSIGTAFKPYLVTFKAGTAISFYKDGKVQSGTLASDQNLIKSIPHGGGSPDFVAVDADTTVEFSKDGFVLGF